MYHEFMRRNQHLYIYLPSANKDVSSQSKRLVAKTVKELRSMYSGKVRRNHTKRGRRKWKYASNNLDDWVKSIIIIM